MECAWCASLKSPWHDRQTTWQKHAKTQGLWDKSLDFSNNWHWSAKKNYAAPPPHALNAAVAPITSHSHRLKVKALRHREAAAQAEITSMQICWLFPGLTRNIFKLMGIMWNHVPSIFHHLYQKEGTLQTSWNILKQITGIYSSLPFGFSVFPQVHTLFMLLVLKSWRIWRQWEGYQPIWYLSIPIDTYRLKATNRHMEGPSPIFIWLVVGPPLWKIWKSIGMISNPIYGKIKNVPNHQPVIHFLDWHESPGTVLMVHLVSVMEVPGHRQRRTPEALPCTTGERCLDRCYRCYRCYCGDFPGFTWNKVPKMCRAL